MYKDEVTNVYFSEEVSYDIKDDKGELKFNITTECAIDDPSSKEDNMTCSVSVWRHGRDLTFVEEDFELNGIPDPEKLDGYAEKIVRDVKEWIEEDMSNEEFLQLRKLVAETVLGLDALEF